MKNNPVNCWKLCDNMIISQTISSQAGALWKRNVVANAKLINPLMSSTSTEVSNTALPNARYAEGSGLLNGGRQIVSALLCKTANGNWPIQNVSSERSNAGMRETPALLLKEHVNGEIKISRGQSSKTREITSHGATVLFQDTVTHACVAEKQSRDFSLSIMSTMTVTDIAKQPAPASSYMYGSSRMTGQNPYKYFATTATAAEPETTVSVPTSPLKVQRLAERRRAKRPEMRGARKSRRYSLDCMATCSSRISGGEDIANLRERIELHVQQCRCT